MNPGLSTHYNRSTLFNLYLLLPIYVIILSVWLEKPSFKLVHIIMAKKSTKYPYVCMYICMYVYICIYIYIYIYID